jgi:hypothetical protein
MLAFMAGRGPCDHGSSPTVLYKSIGSVPLQPVGVCHSSSPSCSAVAVVKCPFAGIITVSLSSVTRVTRTLIMISSPTWGRRRTLTVSRGVLAIAGNRGE